MEKFNYGANLRAIRQSRGISQETMAFHLNISQASYSRMERQPDGKNAVQVEEIAKILGVSASELINGTEAKVVHHQSRGREWEYKAKEFLDQPIGLIIFWGSATALVSSVYEFSKALSVTFGASFTMMFVISIINTLATICYISYWFRRVKKLK